MSTPELIAAQTTLERILSKKPKNLETRRRLYSLYLIGGDPELVLLEEPLITAENDPTLNCLLAVASYKLEVGNFRAQGIRRMRDLYEAHPNDPMIIYNLATILAKEGELEESKTLFELFLDKKTKPEHAAYRKKHESPKSNE